MVFQKTLKTLKSLQLRVRKKPDKKKLQPLIGRKLALTAVNLLAFLAGVEGNWVSTSTSSTVKNQVNSMNCVSSHYGILGCTFRIVHIADGQSMSVMTFPCQYKKSRTLLDCKTTKEGTRLLF